MHVESFILLVVVICTIIALFPGSAHGEHAPGHVEVDEESGFITADGAPVARIVWPERDELGPMETTVAPAKGPWWRVRMTWTLDTETPLDELAAHIEILGTPDFWWAPHLAPREGDCIGQHVFRSPALIAAEGPAVLTVIPDLDICGQTAEQPWFLDLDVPSKRFTVGLSHTRIYTHVLYEKAPGMVVQPGTVALGFWVAVTREEHAPINPWRAAARFLWNR